MTQATAIKPAAEDKTCCTCPHFDNFNEPGGRGWCNLFDHHARTFHIKTHDCVLNSPTTTADTEESITWVDRDGYPMGEEAVANAYDDPNFFTSPDEPF